MWGVMRCRVTVLIASVLVCMYVFCVYSKVSQRFSM